MNSDEITYNSTDAWLLLAIVYASRDEPATLEQIIDAGDAINHASFTQAELEGGLARLVAGGYIAKKGGSHSLCSGSLMDRGLGLGRRAMRDELDDVSSMLRVQRLSLRSHRENSTSSTEV
jgi:hypothetical protein